MGKVQIPNNAPMEISGRAAAFLCGPPSIWIQWGLHPSNVGNSSQCISIRTKPLPVYDRRAIRVVVFGVGVGVLFLLLIVAVIVDLFLTLAQQHNVVYGHRTGSNISGVKDYPSGQTKQSNTRPGTEANRMLDMKYNGKPVGRNDSFVCNTRKQSNKLCDVYCVL